MIALYHHVSCNVLKKNPNNKKQYLIYFLYINNVNLKNKDIVAFQRFISNILLKKWLEINRLLKIWEKTYCSASYFSIRVIN